jgi:hypothetical protein
MILMQAAWILTMPAFRGSDEFDHVYQAAAVARGQWSTHDPAPHGRGGIVTVPKSIVRAASPVCRYYRYVKHDNCFPIRSVGHGNVEVATAAGAYNPAYYVLVGGVTRVFHGAAVDFAMRAVSALLCALLVAWAAAVTARWATTAWPLVTLSIGLTPILVYSTAIAAPNGLSYASAVLIWASLLGLSRSETGGRWLAVPLVVGSVALVATHTTGAMWLALVGLVAVTLRPLRDWTRLVRSQWATWAPAAGVVLTATALCVAWIQLNHTNALGTEVSESGPFPYAELPLFHALWTLQGIGAFPMRNDPAPIPVYVIWAVPLGAALVALFRKGRRRERVAGATTLLLLAVVPTILTVVSYRTEALAWQGRYSLPLLLGITSLAGLAMDRRGGEPAQATVRLLFALLTTAMTISTVYVGLHEVSHGPTDPVVAGVPGGFVLVGVLTVLGSLAPLLVLGRQRGAPVSPTESRRTAAIVA